MQNVVIKASFFIATITSPKFLPLLVSMPRTVSLEVVGHLFPPQTQQIPFFFLILDLLFSRDLVSKIPPSLPSLHQHLHGSLIPWDWRISSHPPRWSSFYNIAWRRNSSMSPPENTTTINHDLCPGSWYRCLWDKSQPGWIGPRDYLLRSLWSSWAGIAAVSSDLLVKGFFRYNYPTSPTLRR